MTHLLFHHKIQLKLPHIILLNKVLLIHNLQTQYNFNNNSNNTTNCTNINIYSSSKSQSIQTGLNIYTLHSNAIPNYTTSRPPLQLILTNSFSYSLTSTNASNTQHSTTNNNQLNTLNTFPPSQTSNTTKNNYKTFNSKHQIILLQILELMLTLMLHSHNLLQIHSVRQIYLIYLRTKQSLHLLYLNLQFHNQLT